MNQTNPEIAVWEDNHAGHTLAFVEILIRHIYEKTKKPLLFISTQSTFRSEEYQVHLKPLEGRFTTMVVGDNFSEEKSLALWTRFRAIEKELKKRQIHALIVSTADALVKTLGIASLLGWTPGRLKIHSCLLYLGVAYPGRNVLAHLKDRISFWLKSRAPVEATYLDQWAIKRVKDKFGISLTVCPEPLYSMGDYLNQRPAQPSADRKKGVCFGFPGGARSGDRKGPDFLIDAFLKADLPSDARLIYAGHFFDPALLEKFKQAESVLGDRFQVFNGYLKNDELIHLMDQMDVVCLPYRSHVGTSAFFAKTAILGKVILSTNYGWLGWAGAQYNKTVFFENNSLSSLTRALENTYREFSELDSKTSNYRPVSEEEFVKTLAGI